MLQQVLAFITAPAHLVVEWMVLTAVVSSLYHKAEANPRLHAVLSFLVSAGVDLPKLWDALGRLLTGSLPPSSASAKAAAVKPLTVLLMLVGLGALGAGCSPAQQAELAQVEQIVLQDVMKGDQLPQIEADVALAVAGKPGADVVLLVDDALTFLVDMGVIPAALLPFVAHLRAEEHPKAMARRSPVLP